MKLYCSPETQLALLFLYETASLSSVVGVVYCLLDMGSHNLVIFVFHDA